jgi:uncharacterized protein YceK
MKRTIVILLAAMLLAAGCAQTRAQDAAAQKNTDQIVEIATTGMEPSGGNPNPRR